MSWKQKRRYNLNMRLDTSGHMRLEHRLKLAPRMIQSMEILQLPTLALEERIEAVFDESCIRFNGVWDEADHAIWEAGFKT